VNRGVEIVDEERADRGTAQDECDRPLRLGGILEDGVDEGRGVLRGLWRVEDNCGLETRTQLLERSMHPLQRLSDLDACIVLPALRGIGEEILVAALERVDTAGQFVVVGYQDEVLRGVLRRGPRPPPRKRSSSRVIQPRIMARR
jgi:hypothetical protein